MANPFNVAANPPPGANFRRIFFPTSKGAILDREMASRGARSAVLAKAGELRDSGLPPSKVISTLLHDPTFLDAFQQDPDIAGLVKDMVAASAPAPNIELNQGSQLVDENNQVIRDNPKPPDPYTLGKDDTRFSGDNQAVARGSGLDEQGNPTGEDTTEVQTVKGLAQLAGFGPEKIAEIASGILTQKATGDPTETEAAVDKLVQAGLDPQLGEKLKAGLIKITPITNQYGQQIGNSIIDLSDPNNGPGAFVPLNGSAVPGPGGRPGAGSPSLTTGPGGKPLPIEDPNKTFSANKILVPTEYRNLYNTAAQQYDVDPELLIRQGRKESAFNPNAEGRLVHQKRGGAGGERAGGIAQFMPATARRFGIDPFDPKQAIPAQARYMRILLNRYGGNEALALAGYNWGEGNVDKWIKAGGDPSKMPRETLDYITTILGPGNDYAALLSPIAASLPDTGTGKDFVADNQQNDLTTPTRESEAVFGMGPVPVLSEFLNSTIGFMDPSRINKEVEQQRTALRTLRERGINYVKTSNRTALEEQNRILNLLPSTGLFQFPLRGAIQLREFRNWVASEVKADWKVVLDAQNQPTQTRIDAKTRINEGERLLQMIGTPHQLDLLEKKASTVQKSGQWRTLSKQIQDTISTGEDYITDIEGAKPTTEADFQSILAKVKAGQDVSDDELRGLTAGQLLQLRQAAEEAAK